MLFLKIEEHYLHDLQRKQQYDVPDARSTLGKHAVRIWAKCRPLFNFKCGQLTNKPPAAPNQEFFLSSNPSNQRTARLNPRDVRLQVSPCKNGLKGMEKGMYCFTNNIDFGFDWQLAYNQLATHFTQLSTDYQKAIDLGEVLALKVARIIKENQEIRTAKITKVFQKTSVAHSPSVAILPHREEEITIRNLPKPAPRIKKMNSMQTTQPNIFQCTYQCGKIYKSTVSMNLHIKVKHNGGTKKEREEYAKAIFEAEERGETPPQPPINFPPNFLKEFRVTYEYMKKYSM